MGSIDTVLPPADSPNLVLVPATPKERIESLRLNNRAWKGPLSPELYLERENHLINQELTRNGALTCWILTDSAWPVDSRVILAACETLRKKAFLAYDGNVKDILCHGIGSVYVRPEFRERGYAGRMMEELGEKVKRWQHSGKSVLFSVLFSDIGKTFYAQYGWKPLKSSHLYLPPITEKAYNIGGSQPVVRVMTAEDLKISMCGNAAIQKQQEVLRVASKKSPAAKVVIAPDYAHMVWHWAREEFYARHNVFIKPFPHIKGAGVNSQNVYCAWARTHDETPNSGVLYILRWLYNEPTTPEEEQVTARAIAAVLRRAQLEANEWKLNGVELWSPTPLMEKAVGMIDPGISVVHREKSSILSLNWYGAEQGLGSNVEWLWTERYTWF